MEKVAKSAFLFLSRSRIISSLAKRYGLRFGAARFVAGESVADAIQAVRELNRNRIVATLDHLGEFISGRKEAVQAADRCIDTLHAIAASGINSNLSVKLTQLGLDISKRLCIENMRRILSCAKQYGNFVRIDMEDYAHNAASIDIFRILHAEYGKAVGIVIQAYLYKSERDVGELQKLKANLRLVKGAYKEPPEVAFPLKLDVDANFVKLIRMHLQSGLYTAVATHDVNVIEQVKAFAEQHAISRSQFEFQMLYGIRPDLQRELAKEGYTMRVYVPFGSDWFGYFMRRLAERPANAQFVLKSLFKK